MNRKDHPLDGLGAELYPKFLQHIGANDKRLPMMPGGQKVVDFTPCIGGPLSEELWDLITKNASCRYISVFHKDPNQSEIAYHDALVQAHQRCVILTTDDGYVVNVFRNMWYKGIV